MKCSNTQSVLVGDFNVCIEMIENSVKQQLSNPLQCFGMNHHVMLPTHKTGHTSDLVLAVEFSNIIGNVTVEPVNTYQTIRLFHSE